MPRFAGLPESALSTPEANAQPEQQPATQRLPVGAHGGARADLSLLAWPAADRVCAASPSRCEDASYVVAVYPEKALQGPIIQTQCEPEDGEISTTATAQTFHCIAITKETGGKYEDYRYTGPDNYNTGSISWRLGGP